MSVLLLPHQPLALIAAGILFGQPKNRLGGTHTILLIKPKKIEANSRISYKKNEHIAAFILLYCTKNRRSIPTF